MAYTQSQLPSDIFNSSNGDVKNYNGQQVKVTVNSDGTRDLSPVGGGGGGGGSTPDYTQLAQQMLQQQQQANAPLVSQLQSTIPTTQQSFQTQGSALQSQSDPLKQRYQSALDALTAGSQNAINQTNIASAREFGARGVPLSSGAYDQYQQQQALPVNSAYAGNYGQLQAQGADAQLALQNQIAGIPVQQQQSVDQINQAIAQLQAGGNQSAISSALQMYQLQQQAQQQAAQNALAQAQQQSSAALQGAQSQYYLGRGADQNTLALLNQLKLGQNSTPTTSGGGQWS